LSFLITSSLLLHVWISYPEYRRLFPNPYASDTSRDSSRTTDHSKAASALGTSGLSNQTWSFYSERSGQLASSVAAYSSSVLTNTKESVRRSFASGGGSYQNNERDSLIV
jgi:hypothetical protein